MYQKERLHRNKNRSFDTKGKNRILEKLLKTRDFGTFDVYGNPYKFLKNKLIYLNHFYTEWELDEALSRYVFVCTTLSAPFV